MPISDFEKAIRAIRETEQGQERSMYPHLYHLFASVLRHGVSGKVVTDTRQKDSGGNVPDLTISCDTGLVDAKGRVIYHSWIVGEAKTDKNTFSNLEKREEIFSEKQKYILPETEWFLMIDTECIVIRPIAVRTQIDSSKDEIFYWADFSSKKDFCEKLYKLHAEQASDSPALKSFRDGDESRIAVVKVTVTDEKLAELSNNEREQLAQAKRDFLGVVRKSTEMLQGACWEALDNWDGDIKDVERQLSEFDKNWGGYEIGREFRTIKGKNRMNSKEEREDYEAQVLALRKKFKQNIPIAKLAAFVLPAFRRRNDDKSNKPFAIESANQILARVLLLRFFEDHNFFDNQKYVCNGGVAALQKFMHLHKKGYTVVLSAAYERGRDIYNDAFDDETDLDWVLSSPSKRVSRAIEMTMMLLSRFDFSTISGDILTGIYDRFLDREQRKAMGEFYTPPSIARYIVSRLDIQPTDSVFDPACGSGTFLLEAFDHITKGDIRSGRGNYKQAKEALANIGGNDINPFSAIMAQIQTLWHLLPLKSELKNRGFPELRVTGSINAITEKGELHNWQDSSILYTELNQPVHDAVIGNPPYVRPERQGDMDRTQMLYRDIGGAKKNFYDLFVYKALTKWCRPANGKNAPGRLGFVLPLSFCDSNNSAPLRRLFEIGGDFCLLEIVDMEAIAPLVFDASVNPIVLLAENRPATDKDKIILRVAGKESVIGEREFDLTRASESSFNYADVFTPDGKILTKLNAKRMSIIDKMGKADNTLADIARIYWVGIGKGNSIEEWRDTLPENGSLHNGNGNGDSVERQGLRWEEKSMLSMGAAFRNQEKIATDNNGLDYYRGRNISTCLIEGEAAKGNVLPDSPDDASFWRFRHILPNVGYAFLRISLGITAARFNPHERAFLNTATLLFPNAEWENFPLDIALSSRFYQFYYACYLREGAVSELWSNLYPRTLEKVPLPSVLLNSTNRLEKLRESFLDLCEKINKRIETLNIFLREVGAEKLNDVCRSKNLGIKWSDGLHGGKAVQIDAPKIDSTKVKNNRLLLKGGEWLEIADAEIMHCLAAALITRHGQEMKKEDFQKMLIPPNAAALADFKKKVSEYDSGTYSDKLESVLAEVDDIVGAAFKLSAAEIKYVQKEMQTDDFLRKIRPKMPFVKRRQHGLAGALANPNRYERKQS